MKNRKLWALAVALVAMTVAGAVYQSRAGGGGGLRQTAQTITVEEGDVAPTLAVTGSVAADEHQVNASASGRVAEVLVKEGDVVTAGQILLRLETTSTQQDLDVATANLTSAEARLQELKSKSASTAEIATQEAAVAKARAEQQKATEARNAVTITAPAAGTVLNIAVAAGDQVGGGQTGSSGTAAGASTGAATGIVTIADLGKLHIKAAVDQADISKVVVGQEVQVSLDALPGKTFGGSIASIDAVPVTEQNVVTYTAMVSVDRLDSAARLGMSADISVDLGKKEGVLVVPNAAIRSRGDSKTVTKMVQGKPRAVKVEVGAADSDNTEITSGLAAGDAILLRPLTTAGQTAGGSVFGGQRRSGFGGPPGMGGSGGR